MYSYKNARPASLPKRVTLDDGTTRTALHEHGPVQLAEWGFVPALPEPTPALDQLVEWGGSDWTVRDKTPEELAEELSITRSEMVVTRTQFASACFIAGVITGPECRDWASGNALPANVEAAIDAAIPDPQQQVVALTKAGSEINVRRNNLLIGLLAASPSFDMTEIEVDQLFALAEWVD